MSETSQHGEGYLCDNQGNRSTGRALAWLCVFGALAFFWAGYVRPATTADHAYKCGAALLVAAAVFYNGGKGLEKIEAIWGRGQ
jgi:peptidoglycan/LPS O-acetylase OafA/YrhL